MPIFLGISRHSPESCPGHNEKTGKIVSELADKLEGLLRKHGVSMIGGWIVPSEHLIFAVYDAPSLEAFKKLSLEPEIARLDVFSTTEYKLSTTFEVFIASILAGFGFVLIFSSLEEINEKPIGILCHSDINELIPLFTAHQSSISRILFQTLSRLFPCSVTS